MSIIKKIEPAQLDGLPLHEARDITEGGDLAKIKLEDQIYTLRITRAGKLILTK